MKLFVVGNHELRGSTYGGKGMFVRRLYPDPEERARHVLASDMAGNWERIWGEKYEPVWHKVVRGFHFFGTQWGEGGSLGADWVMPFGKYDPHPFSLEEQKKKIGEPQFREDAKLKVFLDRITKIANTTNHNPLSPVQEDSATLRLCVKIPLADGDPDSRVYAYDVVVVGDGQELHKVVYTAGCNMGVGHEPNDGVTELSIPKSELPPGDVLTITAHPITSLSTHGKPLVAKWHNPIQPSRRKTSLST